MNQSSLPLPTYTKLDDMSDDMRVALDLALQTTGIEMANASVTHSERWGTYVTYYTGNDEKCLDWAPNATHPLGGEWILA